MTDQTNFITDTEERDRTEKHKAFVRECYQLWLKAPDLYTVPYAERETMKNYPANTSYNVYSQTIHICAGNDKQYKIWLNSFEGGSGEFWVINRVGEVEGKRVEVCPYCGARLTVGEGQIALTKSKLRAAYYAQESVRAYYGLDEEAAE